MDASSPSDLFLEGYDLRDRQNQIGLDATRPIPSRHLDSTFIDLFASYSPDLDISLDRLDSAVSVRIAQKRYRCNTAVVLGYPMCDLRWLV